MLLNGLFYVADRAAQASGEALARQHREALILGALREDVIALPTGQFSEYPSFRHFGGRGLPGGYLPLLWPGPRWTAGRFYQRALGLGQAGQTAAAFVQLGRLTHLLADMSIPSHVHRAAHDRDPFEWYVEGNLRELGEAPGPVSPQIAALTGPEQLIASLARHAARHAPDRTNTPGGRLLRRLGLVRPVSAALAREQAAELLPLAVAHAAALLRLPRTKGGAWYTSPVSDGDDVLQETLDALEIPRKGLGAWFAHNRAFCMKHGGKRIYGELIDLMDRCDEALARKPPGGGR